MECSGPESLRVPFIEQFEEKPHRSRAAAGFMSSTVRVAVAVGLLSVAVAVALFVGGFYLGRNTASSSSSSSPFAPSPTTPMNGASQGSPAFPPGMPAVAPTSPAAAAIPQVQVSLPGGASATLTAIAGLVPVEVFLQCIMSTRVAVGGITCIPANAIVSPAGSVLLALYSFQGDTSIIVTATGTNFGASVATVQAQFNLTLAVRGLEAEVMDSTQLPGTTFTLSSGQTFLTPVVISDIDSFSLVFDHVVVAPSLTTQLYFSGLTEGLSLFLLDSSLEPVRIAAALPSATAPLTMTWPLAAVQLTSSFSAMLYEPTPVYTSPQLRVLQTAPSTTRMRRGVGSAQNATRSYAVELRDQASGATTHRVQIALTMHSGLGLRYNVTRLDTNESFVQEINSNQMMFINGAAVNASQFFSVSHSQSSLGSTASTLLRPSMGGWKIHRLVGSSTPPAWAIAALSTVHSQASIAASNAAGGGRRSLVNCVWHVLHALGDSCSCASDVAQAISSDGAELLDPFFDWHLGSSCWGCVHDWWTIGQSC